MDNDISENIKRIRFDIGEAKAKYRRSDDSISIMAVTKTVPYERVNMAVAEGITLLGENRVQEYLGKKDFYDKKAEVHFIGRLQSNKIKYIINNVTMIQSVDSERLAAEIDRYAGRAGIIMNILLEVNIGGENTKGGISPGELRELVLKASGMKNIHVKGLMTIPPLGETERSFYEMAQLFDGLKNERMPGIDMDILSMGMSSDYVLAVKYGSNTVRIGSAIFGSRK